MPITLDEVKDKIDILFQTRDELEAAFANAALGDELARALSYINDGGSVDWEYFNRILIAANLGPVDRRLFERYFTRGINSGEKLHEGVTAFTKDALLHFGSFHQAFLRLKADVDVLPKVEHTFGSETRVPFALSNPLKVEELAYLGYVSGELPVRMSKAHQTIFTVLGSPPADLTSDSIKAAARARGVDNHSWDATSSSRVSCFLLRGRIEVSEI